MRRSSIRRRAGSRSPAPRPRVRCAARRPPRARDASGARAAGRSGWRADTNSSADPRAAGGEPNFLGWFFVGCPLAVRPLVPRWRRSRRRALRALVEEQLNLTTQETMDLVLRCGNDRARWRAREVARRL